jgi:hypothetical protein
MSDAAITALASCWGSPAWHLLYHPSNRHHVDSIQQHGSSDSYATVGCSLRLHGQHG